MNIYTYFRERQKININTDGEERARGLSPFPKKYTQSNVCLSDDY
jgi:hypothetical protein